MATTEQVFTRLEPDDWAYLAMLARRNERSIAAEARVAITEHLNREKAAEETAQEQRATA